MALFSIKTTNFISGIDMHWQYLPGLTGQEEETSCSFSRSDLESLAHGILNFPVNCYLC